MTEYFFDTFALFEIINGNPNYKNYSNCDMKLCHLNLYEFYKELLRKGLPKFSAEKELINLLDKQVEIMLLDIVNSAELKLINPKFSIPDCFGYVMAKRLKIKFLTGDKEFKDMDNVEFVQK